MERALRNILWTIVGILIFIGIVKFVWWMMPVILLIIAITFVVRKFREFTNKDDNSNEYEPTVNTSNTSSTYNEPNEDYSGDVIDVDFKEVEE